MSDPAGFILGVHAQLECDRILAEQHGVISRKQALAAGLGIKAIESRVSSGRWRSLHPGVYAPALVPDSWYRNLMAAVLSGGEAAFASHRSAGLLWRLEGIERGAVELSITSGRHIKGALVHRRSRSDAPRVVPKDGIPVSDIDRTLIDLAAVSSPARVGLALDEALRRGQTSLERLTERLDSLNSKGRRGAAALRRHIDQRDETDSTVESRLEASLLGLLRASGLPVPLPQYAVIVDGEVVARLDFAYPSVRLGIETDGYRWHGGRDRWARDMRRENRLKLLGWTILRFSWDDMRRRPQIVADQIEAALEGTHLIHPRISGVVETS